MLDFRVSLCLFFNKRPSCFVKWLFYLTFPLAICKGSRFSTSSPGRNRFYYSRPSRTSVQFQSAPPECLKMLGTYSCAYGPFLHHFQ